MSLCETMAFSSALAALTDNYVSSDNEDEGNDNDNDIGAARVVLGGHADTTEERL